MESLNFSSIFYDVPTNPKQRSDESLKPLLANLTENNMFFAKINYVISTCFLKLNPFVVLEKGTFLYKIGE